MNRMNLSSPKLYRDNLEKEEDELSDISKGQNISPNVIALDSVNPLFSGAILYTISRSRLQEKKGKSYVWAFSRIVPGFPVKIILEMRKTLLNGLATVS